MCMCVCVCVCFIECAISVYEYLYVHVCVVWYEARMEQTLDAPQWWKIWWLGLSVISYMCLSYEKINCEWSIPRWKNFVNCFLIWNTMGYSCWQLPQVCSEVLMGPFLHQNKLIVSQSKAINCVLLATPTLSFSLVNLEGWWEGRERRKALTNQIALHIFTFCSWLISG